MKYKKLGIPYMGSKRKLAGKLVDYILSENPNTKYVYDLFGGGGAMSFEFLQRPQIEKVFYNELNTGVAELLKKIKNDGVTADFYKWISREDFHKLKNNNDWIGGLVSTCWSFGNNQRTYMFGEKNELLKKPLHEIVVNRDIDSIKEFENLTGILIPKELLSEEKIIDRRLAVMRYIKKTKRSDLEQLEQLQQLQRLEQLEQLQRLQQLVITNLDYMDVCINTPINETIIYLDPPYVNTEKYACGINHNDLYEWISKCKYKIYLSSYESPMNCVFSVEHRSTLSATNNSKKTNENLYCNLI
jgi:site-specific DNA-adenine methylase